jgi:hypothetical protein
VAADEVRLRHLRMGPRLPPQPGTCLTSLPLSFLSITFSLELGSSFFLVE